MRLWLNALSASNFVQFEPLRSAWIPQYKEDSKNRVLVVESEGGLKIGRGSALEIWRGRIERALTSCQFRQLGCEAFGNRRAVPEKARGENEVQVEVEGRVG